MRTGQRWWGQNSIAGHGIFDKIDEVLQDTVSGDLGYEILWVIQTLGEFLEQFMSQERQFGIFIQFKETGIYCNFQRLVFKVQVDYLVHDQF